MEPIFGFLLYGAACVVVALVAKSKGRSAIIFFLAPLVLGPLAVMLAAGAGADGMAAALAAFAVPAVALLVAIGSSSADEIAADRGSFRGKKKCPMCAEPVRAEAIKCKHCGADLPRQQAEETAS